MSGDGGNLYRRGKTWYGRVQAGGQDYRRSLRTRSLAEARKRVKAMMAELSHLQFYGERRHWWKEAVVAWSSEAGRVLRPATIDRYRFSLGRVRGFLDDLFIDEITPKIIAQIARRPGVTNATRRRDITAVSAVLRWCVAQGWRDDNPARLWDRSAIRERRDPIRLPEPYDIDCAVAAAPRGMTNLIRWAQYTGMRQEECAALEWSRVDLRRRTATLIRTKTGRARAVPIDDRGAGTLAGTPRHVKSPFVFWHDDGERYHNLATQFAAVTRRAQTLARKAKTPVPQRFRFHDLRHWFAVDYLRRGGSIYDLQKILGHSSVLTTEGYLDFLTADEQQKAKYGQAHPPAHTVAVFGRDDA